MSQSATFATQNEAMRRLEPSKGTIIAELTISTAIRPSRGRLRLTPDSCGWLRTTANGCGQLRTVANAASSEHSLRPQSPRPRVKREPLLRIREKTRTSCTHMPAGTSLQTYASSNNMTHMRASSAYVLSSTGRPQHSRNLFR